ncbi:MAG: adenylate/guanylate cyclase domain-containing protein [Rhodospirillales bacterium]|jgi:adenylate cyclase|nr:adenylate/guanylate cyclase domain-containing protein [Rhodospirillales bacterium]
MAKTKTPPAAPSRPAEDWDAAMQSVSDWLIGQALKDTAIEDLFTGLCERLLEAGLPLWRAHVALSTLHPMFIAKGRTWRRDGGLTSASFRRGDPERENWLKSPLHHLVQADLGELRRRLEGANAELDFPVLEEFRSEGATDYLAFVTPFSERPDALARRDGMATSWTTDQAGGFTDGHVATLRRLEPRLGATIKMRVREETAVNVVSAYLGTSAGKRVLDGHIQRGDAETLNAAIWYSDLRGSTAMADGMPPAEFLGVLNAYFECTAGAVLDHGGEVLRFIGDAVLAIFPIDGPGGGERAARMAIAAATDAEGRMARVNAERAEGGEHGLEFGLGLHVGELMFGNIGVPERVEFSVIGPAANEVARLEDLTKELDRRVVMSAAFARLLPRECESLGRHRLRGVSAEQEVFAPPASG